jgi:drug/metabolite transporter (DMT)-like permease
MTAANFVLAAPVGLIVFALLPDGVTPQGAALACLSGIVTSGLGYALWYTVLPRLDAALAAVAQLTVPVIALAGGLVFLGEAMTLRFGVASALVLGGVALSVLAGRRR